MPVCRLPGSPCVAPAIPAAPAAVGRWGLSSPSAGPETETVPVAFGPQAMGATVSVLGEAENFSAPAPVRLDSRTLFARPRASVGNCP
jgi:hypothetical protein